MREWRKTEKAFQEAEILYVVRLTTLKKKNACKTLSIL